METQVHIRGGLTNMEYLVLSFYILTQSASLALSTNSDQTNWEMCKFESLDFDLSLCNPGSVRNTYPYSCSSKKHCCPCPSGAFMDMYNNCSVCKPLRDCEAEGKQVLDKGSATKDTVCGDDIPVTTERWSTVPGIMTTLSPAVESTSAIIQLNQTNPHLAINTIYNPTGVDEEGHGGTSVVRFGAGSAVLVFLCTLLVICFFVILLFIYNPKIPQRLHAVFSKRKPQRDFRAIPRKDPEVEGGKVTDV